MNEALSHKTCASCGEAGKDLVPVWEPGATPRISHELCEECAGKEGGGHE
jgi:hypothetical protein